MTADQQNEARAIFLDVDGTYAHHGVVPAANASAVRRARAAGHRVFVCTGRPLSLLPEHILAAGFDGTVTGAGAHVTVGDRVLRDQRFPAEIASRALRALDAHEATYVLEAPEAMYALPSLGERLGDLFATRTDPAVPGGTDVTDEVRRALDLRADLAGLSFGKITCFGASSPITEIAESIGPEVGSLPSSIPEMGHAAGEIHLSGVHKAVGIEAVIAYLGLPREMVVAVGDGANDVEMLAFAGVGVAISGGHPEALAAADRVAEGPQREGLTPLFAELGLFDGVGAPSFRHAR